MSTSTSNLALAVTGLIALIIGLGVFNFKTQPDNVAIDEQLQHATYLYDQQVAIPDFDFIDNHGRSFTKENIRDQWTLWFFGFTHCPDICPTTLATLSHSLALIEQQQNSADLAIVFVSVDPERDTPEHINNYISGFDSRIIGTSGYDQSLSLFLKNMGIIATLNKPTEDSTDYLVDHSSAVYLIAPDTAISAVFNTPHQASTIAADFVTIQRNLAP